ncbi:hypothetical protein HPP92_017408 [Vanilla planifolia]|uniref:Exocyst subunit Exo70 family protein n=1 Tax=Vanilla planifolia TaxID=51239 RepID=A0A835Q7X9_VANPL|nr:hypothetical protein HPP92_017408 [Vanilla planifolia]
MARKVAAKLFSFGRHSRGGAPAGDDTTSPRLSIHSRLMEENIANAEVIIMKWDSSRSSDVNATSLFAEGGAEVSRFLRATADLHRALVFYSSPNFTQSVSSRVQILIRAQNLMKSAMGRLEFEFHRILSAHALELSSILLPSSSSSSSSSDDEDEGESHSSIAGASEQIRGRTKGSIHANESSLEKVFESDTAIGDLRSIADAMIDNGYSWECFKVYKIHRTTAIEEGLYRHGFDLRLPSSKLSKLDWVVVDRRIESWLVTARSAFSVIFATELHLCDRIFSASGDRNSVHLKESCFADITHDAALRFLSFPESLAKTKPAPEKLFRLLEIYKALSDIWPQIEQTFSFASTSSVRSKALDALAAIASAARDSLTAFELALHKEVSKEPVAGGAVHPLAEYAMNYLADLADHVSVLAEIHEGIPFRSLEPLPETLAPSPSTVVPPQVAERMAWLLFVLLCKLDHKAEFYKEVSLSYLFLANNLLYVATRVMDSGLRLVVGRSWAERHEATARRYLENHLRITWGKVAEAVAAAMNEGMAAFESAFEQAAREQEGRVLSDAGLREEVRVAVEKMIFTTYRESSTAAIGGTAARWSPDYIKDRLAGLFVGPTTSE